MKRLLTTRYGFFGLASIVCFSTLFVIDPAHRWIAAAAGILYAIVALLFFFDEAGRDSGDRWGPRGGVGPG